MKPQIGLLGSYQVTDTGGDAIRLPTRKSWALLAYLAMSDGRDIPREKLAALLWPRSNDGQARASLRQELAVLRKVLAKAGLPDIASTKDSVRFQVAVDMVDARSMARLVKDGALDALRRAVGLYRGDLLSGLNISAHPFEDWLWVERQRLKALAQSAYLQLLDVEASAGDAEVAITTARALLEIEPTQEQAHRALMRLYQRTGRRPEALQQFQRCGEILRRELDTEPSLETVALAGRIRANPGGGRSNNGATRLVSGAKAGLPGPVPERPMQHDVTIVALNLSGVPDSGAACDPVPLAEAQDRFLEYCTRVAYAHGGAVLPGPTDRIIMCFGYPQHSASDTLNALRVALSVVSEPVALTLTKGFWPRAGIARGKVLARAGPFQIDKIDLAGAVLQTAVQFSQVARDGEVVISSEISLSRGFDAKLEVSNISPDRYGGVSPTDPGVLVGRLVHKV